MHGSRYVLDGFAALRHLVYGCCGWVLVAPLAALTPKRRDWIAVIGREEGKFLDNTKYFFVEASLHGPDGLNVVHVTGVKAVHVLIRDAGLKSLYYPSFAACWFLTRCGCVVVDSTEWSQQWRCFLLCRARVMQLWHGVGFKYIELAKWRRETRGRGRLLASHWILWVRLLRKWVVGRLRRYDAVVTTSAFYRDRVFKTAFRSRDFPVCGYPRNCVGERSVQVANVAWRNVDPLARERVHIWHGGRRKMVLVAPTFRDTRATPLLLDGAAIAAIDAFCDQHGYEFLLKLHAFEKGITSISSRHLHVLDTDSDVYPLFPYLHALVTDYSSIYMDFLFTDRPVLFLMPDLEQYVSTDRGIQFDIDEMTPGPKVNDWPSLLDGLLDPTDKWRVKREQIRNLAFGEPPYTNATQNILRYMLQRGWLRMPSAGANEGTHPVVP